VTGRLDRYAAVILDVGLGFRAGQDLAIDALTEHEPLARALAEQAYRRGGRYVDVWYFDPWLKASRVHHAARESLTWTPPWLDKRYEDLTARGGAFARIAGDPTPELLTGLDGHRAGLDRMPAVASRLRMQLDALVPWTVVCYPTPAWARLVFGEPDVERLWRDVGRFMRLDCADPAAAWRAHLGHLRSRAQQLTALQLRSVRFRGPGTDLHLGLIPGAGWEISAQTAATGQANVVNLPTEEVYTTPDWRQAEGVVRLTRPLSLGGVAAEDVQFTLADGRIVDVQARSGGDVVRGLLASDERACRLGEIALVDRASPIGQTGLTYFNTLLDENATCHLAFGAGISQVIPGYAARSAAELDALGVNQAAVHTDFMVGGPGVIVTGERADRSTIDIVRDETWQLAGDQRATSA
jgi:aminopeptidase